MAAPPVLVLWGGELSEGIAERIVADGAKRSVAMEARPMEGLRKPALKALAASGVTLVMVLQTVENDEPPESAGGLLRFFKMKSQPPDLLASCAFTVLALGDSNLLLDRQTTTAKDCNKCGQVLDTRMGEVGGRRFYVRGEADERTALQEVEPWIEGLWPALAASLAGGGAEGGSEPQPESEPASEPESEPE
jgi:sulfite reductase alpha subunit-like flavoprotein